MRRGGVGEDLERLVDNPGAGSRGCPDERQPHRPSREVVVAVERGIAHRDVGRQVVECAGPRAHARDVKVGVGARGHGSAVRAGSEVAVVRRVVAVHVAGQAVAANRRPDVRRVADQLRQGIVHQLIAWGWFIDWKKLRALIRDCPEKVANVIPISAIAPACRGSGPGRSPVAALALVRSYTGQHGRISLGVRMLPSDDLVCERSRHSKTARFGTVGKRGDLLRSFGKGESMPDSSG